MHCVILVLISMNIVQVILSPSLSLILHTFCVNIEFFPCRVCWLLIFNNSVYEWVCTTEAWLGILIKFGRDHGDRRAFVQNVLATWLTSVGRPPHVSLPISSTCQYIPRWRTRHIPIKNKSGRKKNTPPPLKKPNKNQNQKLTKIYDLNLKLRFKLLM